MTFGQVAIGTILRYVNYEGTHLCATDRVIEQDTENGWTRLLCKCGKTMWVMSDIEISPQRTMLYNAEKLNIEEW